jgi:hypothetical protein
MSYKADKIRSMAGTLPAADIAEIMCMSKKTLESLASKEGISLALNLPREKKQREDLAKMTKLEKASTLLRQNGYTVLRPCPFRDYVDRAERD